MCEPNFKHRRPLDHFHFFTPSPLDSGSSTSVGREVSQKTVHVLSDGVAQNEVQLLIEKTLRTIDSRKTNNERNSRQRRCGICLFHVALSLEHLKTIFVYFLSRCLMKIKLASGTLICFSWLYLSLERFDALIFIVKVFRTRIANVTTTMGLGEHKN